MRSTILAAIDSWLFLLFLAGAALFRLLTKVAGSKSEPSESDESTFPRPDQPEQRPAPVSDEEQIRKFLEALGQPRTAKPPPPVTPRTDVPPRPVAPVSPPRTIIPAPIRKAGSEAQPKAQPAPASRRSGPPPAISRRYEPRPPPPIVTKTPAFEVHETAAPLPEVTPTEVSAQIPAADQRQQRTVLDLLRSGRGIREAIILREILGPPRGVEPFELSGAA